MNNTRNIRSYPEIRVLVDEQMVWRRAHWQEHEQLGRHLAPLVTPFEALILTGTVYSIQTVGGII